MSTLEELKAALDRAESELDRAEAAAEGHGESRLTVAEALAARNRAQEAYGDAVLKAHTVGRMAEVLGPDHGAVVAVATNGFASQAYPTMPALPRVPVASRFPEGTLAVPPELTDLRIGKNNELIPDEENIGIILAKHPDLQGIVRYNEFSGELILARPITADPTVVAARGIPRPWTDEDTIVLQRFIQRYLVPKIGRDRIEAVVGQHAKHECAFHPVRDYLQGLEWDGTPRLDTWLSVYFGANKQPPEYLAAVGAAWLISAVARIFEPGCQADNALVFEGSQGTYKSTALRTLAGSPYFSDSLSADLSHKDARDHLRGKWIVELAELSQFKRSEIETVKAFITRRVEQYRPSYGRHEISFPRQVVFAGSTNDETYLVDRTGNRRWWVVSCSHVDLPALTRDRDQLWAETVVAYRAGRRWWLTKETEVLAAAEASLRVAHDPWTADVVRITANLSGPDVSPGEVMAHLNLPTTERHDRNAGRVGQILRDLGWERGKRHKTRGQLYARPMPPEPPEIVPSPLSSAPPPPPGAVPPPPPPPPRAAVAPGNDLQAAQQLVELMDALAALGRPPAVTCGAVHDADFRVGWLIRPQYEPDIQARFEAAGYTPVRNPARQDGLWATNRYNRSHVGVIYGRTELSEAKRVAAASVLAAF